MTIRPASRDEASSLAALSLEVWIGTYLRRGVSKVFADYALSAFTTGKFEALIADENEIILLSDNSEGIDGFVRVTLHSPAPIENCPDTEVANSMFSRATREKVSAHACSMRFAGSVRGVDVRACGSR